MEDVHPFVTVSSLIGEPARARMLWSLLDGRSYTATELAFAADISTTSASNHLSKMLEADLLKVDTQGRHRYFSFARPEVAYAIESLAGLVDKYPNTASEEKLQTGIKYCRSCYDHLAGNVGVQITEAMERKKWIRKFEKDYDISKEGWKWLSAFSIQQDDLKHSRRPLARQCLDWSERKPHLGGQVGALMLADMIDKSWLRKVQFSRELVVTSKGKAGIQKLLGLII
jgi:DNA-binding transcriptional ArsR family regulator